MRASWARFVLLAGLALVMGASCSTATRRTVTTPFNLKEYLRPGEVPNTALAVTYCGSDGKPVVHIGDYENKTHDEIQELWEHERRHVEQLHQRPELSCRENAQLMWGTPLSYMIAEAEATCAQMQWAYYKTRQRGDPLRAVIGAAVAVKQYMVHVKGPTWDVPAVEVAALFVRLCPFAVQVSPK